MKHTFEESVYIRAEGLCSVHDLPSGSGYHCGLHCGSSATAIAAITAITATASVTAAATHVAA